MGFASAATSDAHPSILTLSLKSWMQPVSMSFAPFLELMLFMRALTMKLYFSQLNATEDGG